MFLIKSLQYDWPEAFLTMKSKKKKKKKKLEDDMKLLKNNLHSKFKKAKPTEV